MTPKKFQVALAPLGALLHMTRSYKIPDYQRAYAWKVEKASELWDDLIGQNGDWRSLNSEYLLGSMVTIRKDGKDDVVDGQQRLVSLTLMYCAIRDSLKKYGESGNREFDNRLRDLIRDIDSRVVDRDRAFIKLNNMQDDQAFLKICRGEYGTDNKWMRIALHKNYRELLSRANALHGELGLENQSVDGIEKLRDIINAVTYRVYINDIVALYEVDALQIFQALNARGQQLTQSDLIKSHIIRENKDMVHQEWENIFGRFKNEIKKNFKKADELIYYSMLSRNWELKNKDVSKREMHEAVKEKVKNPQDAKKFIMKLGRDVEIIYKLENPLDRYAQTLKHTLHGLRQINAVYFRRPIITAARHWGLEDHRTVSLAECLLKFFFMYRTVCRMDVDKLRKLAKDLTVKIKKDGANTKNHDLYRIILGVVDRTFVGHTGENSSLTTFHDRFKSEFVTQEYTTGAARYILISIEQELQKEQLVVPAKGFDLEHVFPKKPRAAAWPNHKELAEIRDNIGNLTLLPHPWNAKLLNHSFAVKKTGQKSDGVFVGGKADSDGKPPISYKASKLTLNDYFENCDKWDKDEILKRQKHLLEHAVKIWNLGTYADEISNNS